MKKSGLFLVFIMLVTLPAFATIRTVSNSPTTTIAQFSTIQAAINASNSGDTVYVNGSPINYTSFSVANKQLVIIGPGWSPDKSISFVATVPGCSFTGSASNNSEIQGFVFTSTLTVNSGANSNFRIIRNKFNSIINLDQGSTVYSGFLFEGNVFNNAINAVTSSTYQNFVFQNNIFYGGNGFPGPFSLSGFSQPNNTLLLDHNLFYGPASGNTDPFGSCGYLIITNNIFVRKNAANGNSLSTFANNITFNCGNDTPWNSNSNINSGGNIGGQDPQMVAQTAVNSGTNNPLLDFTIAAGPANNAAIDGKDIGLLFDTSGSLNWTNSRNSRLPRIFSMNITNPTIPSSGTLNVNVEARKSN
jgi:hypothetical protein